MLTWTVRWHWVQAELNMKPQRTKLPSSTDTSCSSVARSSAASTKNPEANPNRSRDGRTYPPSEMAYDRGFQQLLFNSPILLPPCFRPHPTAGCPESLYCHLQAQPKVRALKPENCLKNQPNLLAHLLLSSLEEPKQTYLCSLVPNVWHASIWQSSPVRCPGGLVLLLPVALCFRGLRLSNLHLHWGAVPVPMLWAQLLLAVLAARRPGDDPELPGPFPILSSPVPRLRAGLGLGVAAVAVVAVGGRQRGFALDAAQHDQVDEAAIPALLGQVTARKGKREDHRPLALQCRHPTPVAQLIPTDAAPHDFHALSQPAWCM